MPLVAVTLLDATPFEVAALGTIEFLPFILFSLPAGAWVDRLRRRPILIAGDIGRAVALATDPGRLRARRPDDLAAVRRRLRRRDADRASSTSRTSRTCRRSSSATSSSTAMASSRRRGPSRRPPAPRWRRADRAASRRRSPIVPMRSASSCPALFVVRDPPPRDRSRPPCRRARAPARQPPPGGGEGLRYVARQRATCAGSPRRTATVNLFSNVVIRDVHRVRRPRARLSPGEIGVIFGLGNIGVDRRRAHRRSPRPAVRRRPGHHRGGGAFGAGARPGRDRAAGRSRCRSWWPAAS